MKSPFYFLLSWIILSIYSASAFAVSFMQLDVKNTTSHSYKMSVTSQDKKDSRCGTIQPTEQNIPSGETKPIKFESYGVAGDVICGPKDTRLFFHIDDGRWAVVSPWGKGSSYMVFLVNPTKFKDEYASNILTLKPLNPRN